MSLLSYWYFLKMRPFLLLFGTDRTFTLVVPYTLKEREKSSIIKQVALCARVSRRERVAIWRKAPKEREREKRPTRTVRSLPPSRGMTAKNHSIFRSCTVVLVQYTAVCSLHEDENGQTFPLLSLSLLPKEEDAMRCCDE